MKTILRDNHATNFRFMKMEELLDFLKHWMELEVAKFFHIAIQVSRILGEPHTVQMVPIGETHELDKTFFELLDRSLKDGMLRTGGFHTYVEHLPRIAL